MDWVCGTCHRTFGSWHAREQHMDALAHEQYPSSTFSCYSCPYTFRTQSGAQEHMRLANHYQYLCNFCNLTQPTQDAIKEHEAEAHFWCFDCERGFQSSNNIKMHLNSRVHRGSTITCPWCKSTYTTAAGLAHHLETGSCPKATHLNRDELYKHVRHLDQDGLIANKLIGWQGSTIYEATKRAWNGKYYECYFCHRLFNYLDSLNQHLQSPAHQQKLYHCPNRIHCKKEFTTLAGVCNHLESESCSAMRFETVQRHFQGILGRDRLIGYQ
ncbi:hypothetical protein F4825DRAFT_432329 [Nemania diffusa]|nr:hypothetical protein F4825DRAFT_432329 [Nemania diffusa]